MLVSSVRFVECSRHFPEMDFVYSLFLTFVPAQLKSQSLIMVLKEIT